LVEIAPVDGIYGLNAQNWYSAFAEDGWALVFLRCPVAMMPLQAGIYQAWKNAMLLKIY